jgi:hypothetical protein
LVILQPSALRTIDFSNAAESGFGGDLDPLNPSVRRTDVFD